MTTGTVPATARPAKRQAPALEPRPLSRAAIDVACLVLALALALTALLPAFGVVQLAIAGGLGLAVGTGLALLGARLSWGPALLGAALILAYALFFGPVVAPDEVIGGVIPTPAALQTLAVAAVHTWRDVLTLAPPFDGRAAVSAAPAILALVGSASAVSFALRLRRPWWALVPLAVVLVISVLFGTSDASWVVVRSGLIAALVLGWSAWRWRETLTARSAGTETSSGGRGLAAAAMVGLSVVAGTALMPVTSPDIPRFVLRDHIVPPFDLRDYVSPLQSFRGYVRDYEDEVMLSVSGLPAGARIRLASMDGYDGVVYDVTEGSGGGSFVSATQALPQSRTTTAGNEVTLQVTVGTYQGMWIPTLGQPSQIEFDGDASRDLVRGLYADPESGVLLTTLGIRAGDSYTVTGTVPAIPSDTELAGVAFASYAQPPVESVPTIVATVASEVVADGGDPATLVRALQTKLATEGFFSHGLEDESPSRSGHGSQRIATFLAGEQIVGDDEQYAVAMALMARQLGYPARVVIGWYPEAGIEGEVELTGNDLHVWTEIAFEGYGWVAYDPTPPEDQVPQDAAAEPKSNPQPQVLQPPPTPEPPAEEPPVAVRDRADSDEEEDEESTSGLNVLLIVALAVAAGLVLMLIPLLLILAIKAQRARRRAHRHSMVERVSGGWSEVLDAATDFGVTVPASSTRRQSATELAERFEAPAVQTLARSTDAYVFGAGDPTATDASAQWGEVRQALKQMRAKKTWWARVRARVSLRSLRAKPPAGTPKEKK